VLLSKRKTKSTKRKKATYSVYVVELSKKVWTDSWKFRAANPHFRGMQECLYVGMTSLSPQERYKKHKTGARSKRGHKISCYFVEKYGTFLRSSLYSEYNPMCRLDAVKMEKWLAEDLRKRGFAVWWN
tara:strand:- start:397 stop:780 length:384 start_codon:yes stop_codon:yes gene_type:complete